MRTQPKCSQQNVSVRPESAWLSDSLLHREKHQWECVSECLCVCAWELIVFSVLCGRISGECLFHHSLPTLLSTACCYLYKLSCQMTLLGTKSMQLKIKKTKTFSTHTFELVDHLWSSKQFMSPCHAVQCLAECACGLQPCRLSMFGFSLFPENFVSLNCWPCT